LAASTTPILGKYRIIREIARSNDIVYEALDPSMARRVAVKELQLPPHLAGAQKRERIERFYREAKAAGTLSHRNIVTIHDVGQENDRHFLVMEYLEGQSLRDILQMQGALPLKETVEITLQLCDALAYAHSRGVVHRDVKPDNVHILPGGVIKLTDFGIARITAEPSITSQGQVFGTPSYMSPEQVASHTVDHRTDLFSLGITLYEMLTGRKPFMGDSVITITYNIMNLQPTMPVGVPLALQQILQKALSKDPNQRYQNAAAMAADLRAEKFALTASVPAAQAAHVGRTPPLTFAPSPPLTLDTGRVPAHVSGMPALPEGAAAPPASPAAAAPPVALEATQALPGREAKPRRAAPRVSPAAEKLLRTALPALALLLALAVLAWGVTSIVRALVAHSHRVRSAALSQEAADALGRGSYPLAAGFYAQAASLAPPGSDEAARARTGQSRAYTSLGQEDARTGSPRAAQDAYRTAAQLDGHNADAWDRLGDLQWQGGETSRALDSWERAAHADPASAPGREGEGSAVRHEMDLAQSASSAGRIKDARDLWQRVSLLAPGSNEAFKAAQNLSRTEPSASVTPGVGLPQ
jgi:hypothetical protein